MFGKIRQTPNLTDFFNSVPPVYTSPIPTTSLRVAGILSNHLKRCLSYEINVYDIPQAGWEDLFSSRNIDFILIESCLSSDSEGGGFKLFDNSGITAELSRLITFARRHTIPVIFWSTLEGGHDDPFLQIAARADYVYCAASKSIVSFGDKGIAASPLLPAVQPSLHHPFRIEELQDRGYPYNLIIDETNGGNFTAKYFGKEWGNRFKISLSGNKPSENTAQNPSRDSAIHNRHNLNLQEFWLLMRYTKVFAAGRAISKYLNRNWRTIEAAACGAIVYDLSAGAEDEFLKSDIINFQLPDALYESAKKMLVDDIERNRLSLIRRRKLYSQHTFSHRLKQICQDISLSFDWNESPRVSIIATSYRPHLLNRIIEQFQSQVYPNKELIVVVNSDDFNLMQARKSLESDHGDMNIQIYSVPRESTNGQALNLGISAAAGEYCFKMDDDDLYGKNYLLDMMLAVRSIPFDFFGKRPSFVYFEADDSISNRNEHNSAYIIRAGHDLDEVKTWIAGNTFAGKVDLLQSTRFCSRNIAAADSDFQLQIDTAGKIVGVVDQFNVLTIRSSGASDHTWRPNNLAKGEPVQSGFQPDLVFP